MALTGSKSKININWLSFWLALCLSIGTSFILMSVTEINYFHEINSFSHKNKEYLIVDKLLTLFLNIIVPFFLATFPLTYLITKNFYYRDRTEKILTKVSEIDKALNFEVFNLINDIDSHKFKRDNLINELLDKISGVNRKPINSKLNELLSNWKEKIKDPKKELWRIVYEQILSGVNKSETESCYYVSLETYLEMLLNIIEYCFKIKSSKFIYSSFTNALPNSWFVGNKYLKDYKIRFSNLLKNYGEGNEIKRYVLAYKNSTSKSFIQSENELDEKWKGMTSENKNIYLDEFVLNEKAYKVIFHDMLELTDFNELIYLGYENKKTNKPTWKWALLTEFVDGMNIVKFKLINVIDSDQQNIVKIRYESGNVIRDTEAKFNHREDVDISLSKFPEYIESDNCIFEINNEKVINVKKLTRS